jgi:hypothetical protein
LKASFSNSPGAVVKVGDKVQISGDTENNFTDTVVYTVIAENKDSRDYKVKVEFEPNTGKELKEFGFAKPAAAGIINEAAKGISVKVPFGTDVTKLAAVFTCSEKASVKVTNVDQFSGVTINDFTNPVKYTVMAQDGSVQDYTVTVTTTASDEKKINEFSFKIENIIVKASIDELNHNISVIVPAETDLTKLVAIFTYTGKSVYVGEVQQYSGLTVNDYSKVIVFRVIAHDDSFVEYTVTVNKSKGVVR